SSSSTETGQASTSSRKAHADPPAPPAVQGAVQADGQVDAQQQGGGQKRISGSHRSASMPFLARKSRRKFIWRLLGGCPHGQGPGYFGIAIQSGDAARRGA